VHMNTSGFSGSRDGAVLWTLEAGSPSLGPSKLQTHQVLLNGKPLSLLPGPALPLNDLEGKSVNGGTADLLLPPTSYGFILFPHSGAKLCAIK